MLSDEVTSDSFPQKPGSGGIPARLNRKVAKQNAATGFVVDNPLRSSTVSISSSFGLLLLELDHSGRRCPS